MDDANSRVIADAAPSFPSFIALRAEHSELLQREPETDEGKEKCTKDVEHFIRQVQATGAILSDPEERRSSQNILNYWVSTLYRQDQVARLVTLADYKSTLTDIGDVACPYPGVRAFTEKDSQFFFGRQRQINYMVGRLKEDRLLVIVGASGSGKTSLVQAGLVPALKKEQPNDHSHFFFPTTTPGSDPLMSLALMIKGAGKSGADNPGWVEKQIRRFQRDSGHLLKLINETTDKPAVIFIDQGEELYERNMPRLLRAIENIVDLDNSKKAVEPFLDNLIRVVQSPESKHIVIVARSVGDFAPHLKRLPTRVKEMFEPARVVLPALYASELSDAIQKPGELLGVRFEEESNSVPEKTALSETVKPAETTVQSLIKEISSEAVGLPLLQFILPRLWEKRQGNKIPDQAFREMGSCRVALTKTAEKFYSSLSSSDQRACRRVLQQMVTLDADFKAHAYPVRVTKLYQVENKARVDALIKKLDEQQLVRITRGQLPTDDTVELVHDSLISNWTTMSSWIESKRWARRRWMFIKVVGLAAILAGVMLLAALVIGWQQQRTKSRDLARLSNRQFANDRFDLAVPLGIAAYQTEVNTVTRSNLHKLLNHLQSTPRPKRILRTENFEAIDLAFSNEPVGPPTRLAGVNINGVIVVWNLNWEPNKPPATEYMLSPESPARPPLIITQDGKTLVTASADPRVEAIVWDLTNGQRQDLSFKASNGSAALEDDSEGETATFALALKSDGETLFSAGENGTVIQWDLKGAEGIRSKTLFKHTYPISSLALDEKLNYLAAGDDDGAIFLIDASGKRVNSRVVTKGHVTKTIGDEAYANLALSSNGQLVAASRMGQAMIWQAETGQLQSEFYTGLPRTGLVVSFTDEDRTLLAYSADGSLFSWNVQGDVSSGGRLEKTLSAAESVSISKDGRFLALPSGHGAVVWEVSRKFALPANNLINTVAFRPRHDTLAVAEDSGGGITTWQVQNPFEHKRLQKFSEGSAVSKLAYSADGAILATGLYDGTISLLDSGNLRLIRSLKRTHRADEAVQSASIVEIVFDPRADGHRLVGALNIHIDKGEYGKVEEPAKKKTADSTEIILWNADTGDQTPLAVKKDSLVTALAFRHDGKVLAWSTTDANENSAVTLWDSVAQKPISTPITTPTQVTSLAFSRDGEILAVGLSSGKVLLWDDDYKQTNVLEGVTGEVVDLAFSPDGSILACAINPKSDLDRPRRGTLILWDMWELGSGQTEQLGDLLKGHADAITSIAFSSDGRMLASGSKDEGVLLWDVNVGGARNTFCEIVDCRRRREDVLQNLDKETIFQWLYRTAMRKPPAN